MDQPLEITNLYPNAAKDDIRVEYQVADPTQNTHYTLFDILGKKIISEELDPFSSNEIKISVQNLQAGVYVLVIHQGKNKISRKFVKMYEIYLTIYRYIKIS